MAKLFISPHSDDATLFGAYTILREKPLVITVTHSTLQGNNGNDRVLEDYRAMKILGVPICFLGIDEDKLTEEILEKELRKFSNDEYPEVWCPAYEENGNPQHNLVNKVVNKIWVNVKEYKTYTGFEDRTVGKEVIPTPEELELKKKAMNCYVTQRFNPNTAHYFNTYAEYK